MPRKAQGPRLYLDPRRKQWVIRDGQNFVRTGCARADHEGAQKRLAEYIGSKYRPAPSPSPLIADVLLAYSQEHLPTTLAAANSAFNINNLKGFWGAKKLLDVNARNCRAYAETKSAGGARRDLETLRAAINYWHRFYGPLASVPFVVLPPKSEPRERWLTREEARRLRHAAMGTPHLYRFIVIGLATGSRSGAILGLEWSWIDFDRELMRRRAHGARESKKRTPTVRLGAAILRLLRRWKRLDSGVSKYVCHYNGARVLKIKRSWAKATKRAGLGKDVTPHTLRHTRATWLMQAGVPMWEASGHLGMSVETLQRVYGKHSPDYQKNAAEV
jgi:integrase